MTTQLQTDTDTVLEALAPILYGLIGAAFGIVEYYNGRREGESLKKRRLLKTVLVWFVAGATVSLSPDEFNQVTVAAAATGLAPFVNIALDQLLPAPVGGSPTRGFQFGDQRAH